MYWLWLLRCCFPGHRKEKYISGKEKTKETEIPEGESSENVIGITKINSFDDSKSNPNFDGSHSLERREMSRPEPEVIPFVVLTSPRGSMIKELCVSDSGSSQDMIYLPVGNIAQEECRVSGILRYDPKLDKTVLEKVPS